MPSHQLKFDKRICNEIKDNWESLGFLKKEMLHFIKLAKDKVPPSHIKQLMIEKMIDNKSLKSKHKVYLMRINQEYKLETLKQIHDLFLNSKTTNFHTQVHHYDWWMFPMSVPKLWNWPSRNYDCSCNADEVKILLEDSKFFSNYCQGISLYLDNLEQYSWNDYPVRFARMLHSLSLFLECAEGDRGKLGQLMGLSERALDYGKAHNFTRCYDSYKLLMDGFDLVQEQLSKSSLPSIK